MAEVSRSGSWFAGSAEAGGADPPAEDIAGVASRLAAPATHTTLAGLPVRVPLAHLVPGSFGGEPPEPPIGDGSPPPERSPDAVRSRLADYSSGVRRARQR